MLVVKSLACTNAVAVPLAELSPMPFEDFVEHLATEAAEGRYLYAFFVVPQPRGRHWLTAVLPSHRENTLAVVCTEIGTRWRSFSREVPQAYWLEPEVARHWDFTLEDHPADSGERPHAEWTEPADHPGPCSCHGPAAHSLAEMAGERLRQMELAITTGFPEGILHRLEAATDTNAVAHSLAYCQLIEGLTNTTVPAEAEILRLLAHELERVINLSGAMLALAGRMEVLPDGTDIQAIQRQFSLLLAFISGSRTGRGLIVPGGTTLPLVSEAGEWLQQQLETDLRTLAKAMMVYYLEMDLREPLAAPVLKGERLTTLGLVGPMARAGGVMADVRHDFAYGPYRHFSHEPIVSRRGDGFARSRMWWRELRAAIERMGLAIEQLSDAETLGEGEPIERSHLIVSLVEGWRGRICHVAVTAPDARFAEYRIFDGSLYNVSGVARLAAQQWYETAGS